LKEIHTDLDRTFQRHSLEQLQSAVDIRAGTVLDLPARKNLRQVPTNHFYFLCFTIHVDPLVSYRLMTW
jgi:hypothetical protein